MFNLASNIATKSHWRINMLNYVENLFFRILCPATPSLRAGWNGKNRFNEFVCYKINFSAIWNKKFLSLWKISEISDHWMRFTREHCSLNSDNPLFWLVNI